MENRVRSVSVAIESKSPFVFDGMREWMYCRFVVLPDKPGP
jgi:hypothetical protein